MTDDYLGVVLTPTQLAHFARPLTWSEIFAIEPKMERSRWRFGVLEADEDGRGLLRWTPAPKVRGERRASVGGTWQLTDRGIAFVFDMLSTDGIH